MTETSPSQVYHIGGEAAYVKLHGATEINMLITILPQEYHRQDCTDEEFERLTSAVQAVTGVEVKLLMSRIMQFHLDRWEKLKPRVDIDGIKDVLIFRNPRLTPIE